MPRTLLAVLLLLLVGMPAAAEEKRKPLTVEQASERVLAAANAKDNAALRALAGRDDPDPWIVVELLLVKQHRAAAVAFAQVARGAATEALARYAETHRDPLRRQRLKALEKLNAALGVGAWAQALAGLEAKDAPGLADSPTGVAGTRLVFGRGLALRELDRPGESEAAFRLAAESALSIGWLTRATLALHRAGRQAHATGDRKGAHAHWVRAHQTSQRLGDLELQAMTLSNVGVALLDLGRSAEARTAIESALGIRRQLARPLALGENLVNAAAVYQRMGAYGRALLALDEAHALATRAEDPALRATVLLGLGSMKLLVREPHAALGHFQAALAIARARQDPAGMVRGLQDVGACLATLRRLKEALDYYERALLILRTRSDERAVGRALTGMAGVYVRMGRRAEAVDAFDEALAIQQRTGDPAGAALTLFRLGALHGEAREHAQARAALVRSQAILDDLPKPELQMRVHWALAGVHYGLREWRLCVDRCRKAEEIAAGLLTELGDQEASGAADNWTGVFDTALRAATRLPPEERATELWHFLESGRAHALREAIQARGALEETLFAGDTRDELAAKRNAEARAMAALRAARARQRRAAIRAARLALDAVRADRAGLVARIQRTAKAGAALAYPRPAGLAVIQGQLGPHEALVLYGLTERDAVAMVLTRKAVRPVTLARSERVVAAARALLSDDGLAIDPTAIVPLRKLLIDPLQLPSDVRRVLVSPTRILGYVPFALLLPDRETAFVPSGTTYGLLHGQAEARGVGVLGLGDPVYGKQPSPVRSALLRGSLGGTLPRLPATRKEIEAVADVRLLGAQATEAGLEAALSKRTRWRALHLACHGLIDAERPLFSALALTPDAGDDGLLTCADLFGLRVFADLVTLSACDTAKGRLYRTEGILGLTRAFMFAGAPRVMCSLWKVDDEATQALMIKFYELWNPKGGKQGLGAAAALKKAQEHVREFRDKAGNQKWNHPYYWAAWVLWGLPE